MRTAVWSWWPDGRVVRLTPDDGAWLQANVHPDGDRAVCWGGPPAEPPRLWVSPTNRATPVALTDTGSGARHSSFGADGDRVVFSSDRAHPEPHGLMAAEGPAGTPPAGHWNIFTMAADGSDVRQVTTGPQVDQRPALSPDGSTIAFVSDRGRGLWLIDSRGAGEPRVVCPTSALYRPCWAADGEALYAFRITADRRQVGRVDLADGRFEPFANDDRGNTHGPWLDPAGEVLIVHSDRDGAWGLYELPLDGSPMRALRPPGHEDRVCGHGTRAANGVLTFDEAVMTELTRDG